MSHLNDFDNGELLIEFAKLHRKDALQQVHNVPFTREDSELCMQIRDELLRRMTAAAETTPPAKPAYKEIVTGLERALEHLDYCGWGDSWEREVSEELRKDLPALLERAKA